MEATFLPYIGAFIWLSILLVLGTIIRAKVVFLQKMLVPASLIGGILGFIFVQLGIIGLPTSNGWVEISTKSFSELTFHLFAFGFVGVGLMKTEKSNTSKVLIQGGLWMTIMYGFCQCLQAVIGFSFFEAWKLISGGDYNAVLGYLLGSGFAQGPGQAHAYGNIWETTYGVANAMSVGLAAAALGFIFAVIIGVPLANYGIKKGWTHGKVEGALPADFLRGIMGANTNQPCAEFTTHPANVDSFGFHLSVMFVIYGLAYSFGLAWTLNTPQGINGLGFGILFTWSMCIAMLVRMALTKTNLMHMINQQTIKRITNTSVDYMICAVFLAISVSELQQVLVPLLSSATFAAFVTLWVILWYARRGPEFNFERGLAIFGCYTGTVASGLLLLRIVDPDFKSPAAVELGIMNVMILITCQPLLAGYAFLPAEGFPTLWIMFAYIVLSPIAMYLTRLVRKPTW